MRAASWPRENKLADRLLVVDGQGNKLADRTVGDLADILSTGDLLVLNDSATLPASLSGTGPRGEEIELRLVGLAPSTPTLLTAPPSLRFQAVLFGAGDHRTRTEDRPPPPRVVPGDALRFREGLSATVEETASFSPRLLTVRFSASDAALWTALYRAGRPVQYSYVPDPLPLWHVQTAYAARPWSVEEPSAGRSLTISLLARLRDRGISVATLTHAAGLSATGDPEIDARLPLPERYDIPQGTIDSVARARAAGKRIVAAGTSVVRALEGCFATHDRLVSGQGTTDLRIGPSSPLHVVTDLLTGMHEPGTSHFELLQAFVPPDLLSRAHAHAEAQGYLGHELGDFTLYLDWREGDADWPDASRSVRKSVDPVLAGRDERWMGGPGAAGGKGGALPTHKQALWHASLAHPTSAS